MKHDTNVTIAKSEYWAAAPTTEIANEIDEKFDSYLKWLAVTGVAQRIQSSFNMYYGYGQLGGFHVDKQDEAISKVTVKHFKNLISRIHSMTVQAKLSFNPKATNSDSKSLLQTDLAKGLLEYEISEGLGQITSNMVEQSLVMFGAYVYAPWDKNKGEPLAVHNETGKVIMSGDQSFYNLSSFQVARSTSMKKTPYYIVETKANRYDLLAAYPDHTDTILSASNERNPYQLITPFSNQSTSIASDEDTVTLRTLIHEKTPALPKGRIVVTCNGEVLSNDVFYYKTMPVIEMEASSVMGEVVSDSPASSLIGLQEVLDRVYSAQITNVLNGCIANIYSPDPNISISQIRKGQNLIVASQPPVAVSMIPQDSKANELINDLINQETLLSGLNNTAKGNPEASLKSGTSLSLILSTAIQYISPIQQAYAQATASIATVIIHNLQSFCQVERIAFIAGIAQKSQARAFKAEDIAGVERISVELGNPLTQTVSGRMELLQNMLQMKVVTDPSKIDEFLKGGNLEALTEDKFSQTILIKSENEMLRRGQAPKVILSDRHDEHTVEHFTVLYSQEARNDPSIVAAVLSHVQEHLDLWPQVPPAIALAIGLPPAPPPAMPPQGPEGQPGQPQDPQAGMPKDPNQPAPNVNGTPLPNGRGIPEGFQQGYQDFAQNIGNNPAAGQDPNG